MPTGKKRIRETKRKTKTFSGCWTCRGRKVKCDTTRPECNRCGKAGLECEGYHLKLYWVTDEDTIAPSAIKRQAMSLEGSQAWAFPSDEVDRQLASIDTSSHHIYGQGLPVSTGPFGVFDTQTPAWEELEPGTETDVTDCVSSGSDNYAPCKIAEGASTYESSDWQLSVASVASSGRAASPFSHVLNPSLFQDPVIHRLMDNYVNHVANVLPPVPHPENPYALIYVPKALDGASNLLFGSNSTASKIPSIDTAIFYALLATSAFHLRGTPTTSGSDFDVMARGFRAKSFASLQRALQEPVERDQDQDLSNPALPSSSHCEAIISAMLTLITMDIVEGSMSEYWIHLDGVESLARQLRDQAQGSPNLDRLITISSFLSTLADTTSIELPSIPWTEADLDHRSLQHSSSVVGYRLEFAYGITPALAELMRRMVRLSQNISYYVSESAVFPPALISACNSLSDALSQWSIDSEPLVHLFTGPDTATSTKARRDFTLQLATHHILAFAHALRVYYHTRILPCTPCEMTQFIDRVANHLTAIEEIKARAGYDSNIAATITWPGFIASCEAARGQSRDVWYRWWASMLKYRIGNMAQLWEIVQEAWALRDNEGVTEVPAWMPVLRRSGKRILAV